MFHLKCIFHHDVSPKISVEKYDIKSDELQVTKKRRKILIQSEAYSITFILDKLFTVIMKFGKAYLSKA